MKPENKTRILILGGGFGGIYAALRLQKKLRRDQTVEITLVNRENFFLFTPMLHEIAALKSKRSDRETVVLEHFEKEEAIVAQAKQAEQRIAEEERKLKAGEAELEREGAALDQAIHSIKVDRDQVRPGIPAPLLARYDRLSGTRDAVAVAEVRKGACGACFKSLTPHAAQEMRRLDAVHQCEACGRILIWTEGSAA